MGFPEWQRGELNKYFSKNYKTGQNCQKTTFKTLETEQRHVKKLRCVYSRKPTETWLRIVGLYDVWASGSSHHPFSTIRITAEQAHTYSFQRRLTEFGAEHGTKSPAFRPHEKQYWLYWQKIRRRVNVTVSLRLWYWLGIFIRILADN